MLIQPRMPARPHLIPRTAPTHFGKVVSMLGPATPAIAQFINGLVS